MTSVGTVSGVFRPIVVVALGLVASSCSSVGGLGASTSSTREETCALVERLSESADALQATGASDPDAFRTALDAAVLDYVTTLDALAEVVPDEVRGDVEVLSGLVNQHRFTEALETRASLDEYVRRICGDQPPTT